MEPVRRLLILAGAAVLWERLWPRLGPAAALAGLFAAVALADLLPALPVGLHRAVLVAFALAFLAALWRLKDVRRVDGAAARRRLERDSGLPHRPFTALADDLAAGANDPQARALWQVHRRRTVAATKTPRLAPPSPRADRHDRWALRFPVVLALVVAAVAGRHEPAARLARALVPGGGDVSPPPVVQVWITPPAYTGRAITVLDGPRDGPVAVVAGSAVLARITGAPHRPNLRLDGRPVAFEDLGEASYRAETVIESGSRLEVRIDGAMVAGWSLAVQPDRPPAAAFAAPPAATARHRLRLAFTAVDDWGVTGVAAEVGRFSDEPPLRLALPLASRVTARITGVAEPDLTAHPWAGLPVTVRLIATDARGQQGMSASAEIDLPQRPFHHPVARALIEERRRLAGPAPDRAAGAAALAALAAAPPAFAHDVTVYLALRVAAARLVHSDDAAVASVLDLLWDTALALEEGRAALSEREVAALHRDLDAALAGTADAATVEGLLRELEQAVADHLEALRRQALDGAGAALPVPPSARVLGTEDIRALIEEVRALVRSGAVDAARQRLADLGRLLEDLRAGLQSMPSPEQAARAGAAMANLRGLVERQRELMDRTYRRGRGLERRDDAADADAQGALRRRLGAAMLDLDVLTGAIPSFLGEAERAMHAAAAALRRHDPLAAAGRQNEAVEQLQNGLDAAAQALAGGLGGMSVGAGMPFGGPGRDPFGRRPGGTGGFATDGDGKLPTAAETGRARAILDELRRRAADRRRSEDERAYLERLLERF